LLIKQSASSSLISHIFELDNLARAGEIGKPKEPRTSTLRATFEPNFSGLIQDYHDLLATNSFCVNARRTRFLPQCLDRDGLKLMASPHGFLHKLVA
jgi:hypothetical protein